MKHKKIKLNPEKIFNILIDLNELDSIVDKYKIDEKKIEWSLKEQQDILDQKKINISFLDIPIKFD